MEQDAIAEKAIEKLQEKTGIAAEWKPGAGDIDGQIAFTYNHGKYQLPVEVKKEIRAQHLIPLTMLKAAHGQLMVIAEHIYPKLKEELRTEGIAYLETNGNLYFKQDDLYLWLEEGRKEKRDNMIVGRAFAKTGLKLLFHILIDPDLLKCTYRHIAERTGVPFGNINFILTDLKEQGFLLPLDKGTYTLTRKKELLHKWMQGYKDKLQPALKIGTFQFADARDYFNWEEIRLRPEEAWWGGQPAGAILTGYIKPEAFTLYTNQRRADLIKAYQLVPTRQGEIQVFQKFWHLDDPGITAPPLLVYADLMNTGDRRCIETAEKIYHAQLQDKY